MLKFILILLAIVAAFFVLTFVVYFFNLDMKMMAAMEPIFDKIYDKRKRDRKI